MLIHRRKDLLWKCPRYCVEMMGRDELSLVVVEVAGA